MSNKLTVIIPCKNEREHIRACIMSARQVADEVLVADSGSTDGTLEIARELGCRIIEREYGTSGDFKNWAIPQAAHEWVLILDADERITPALAAEIRGVLAEPRHDGYWIYRRNHFMGHPIRFGPWKNDRCLRLFRRDLGRYVGPTDHAEVELSSGTVGRLRERLTHYTCDSYSQYLPKLSRYADVQARIWQAAGPARESAAIAVAVSAAVPARLRVAAGVSGWPGRAASLRAGGVSVVVEAGVSVAIAERPRLARAGTKRVSGATGSASAPSKRVARARKHWRSQWHTRAVQCEGRKLELRELRHRLTPNWLRTDARRRWRNIVFRRLGIQRCYTPPIITREPELAVRSCLPFVVAHELLRNPRLTFLQIGAFDGVGDDDLRELIMAHKLRGVLVEPQPSAFARLAANVSQPAASDAAAGGDCRAGRHARTLLPPRRGVDGRVVRSRPPAPARHPRRGDRHAARSPVTRSKAHCAPPGSRRSI